MPCKPGVAGSIPGFSIKPLSVEPLGVPVINTHITINPPGPVLVTPHGKATKRKKSISLDTLLVVFMLHLI